MERAANFFTQKIHLKDFENCYRYHFYDYFAECEIGV